VAIAKARGCAERCGVRRPVANETMSTTDAAEEEGERRRTTMTQAAVTPSPSRILVQDARYGERDLHVFQLLPETLQAKAGLIQPRLPVAWG
jgi:hypothetical protein